MSETNSAEINSEIDRTVDAMLSMLKRQLLSPSGFEKRGVWDRFKNWMSNIWHGRYSSKNPYYFTNTLGDFTGAPDKMPKKESFNPSVFTLNEYTVIKQIFDQLERDISIFSEADMSGAENLKLIRILDDWSKQLKMTLKNLIAKHDRKKPAPSSDPEKNACEQALEAKYKEKKISTIDYRRIKNMMNSGDTSGACAELQKLLTPVEAQPEEKEMEPENKDTETQPEEKEMEPENKDTETQPEEKDTEPENKDTENQPENKDTENKPEEWPLNHGNTKEDFEKIQADVDDPSGPYNSRWEAFKDESKSDEKIKKKYERIKATRNKIRQLIKDNDTDGEDMRKSMHTYKDALHDVIAPHTESISMTFESWVKPHHALPLFERTEYFKKLLNRG